MFLAYTLYMFREALFDFLIFFIAYASVLVKTVCKDYRR